MPLPTIVPQIDLATLPACEVLPVTAADGAKAELLLQMPIGPVRAVIYWLPALGISAKHYLPLAQALASRGMAVAIHEWRGIGSSDRRAGRHQDWGYRELLEADLPAGQAVLAARLSGSSHLLGGHSLGAQLAALYAALNPSQAEGLIVVASGSPYWRCFRYGPAILLAYVLAPWLARLVGYLPGRQIGFGGNEARRVIADWALTGRSGRYAAVGMADNLEQRLGALKLPLLALRQRDDWMVPEASLEWLLGKMPSSRITRQLMTSIDFEGRPADHFGWMKTPMPLAACIADWISDRRA